MFREILITVASGCSHIQLFNISINIQKCVRTIASIHFITTNAVSLVKIQTLWRGFMAFFAKNPLVSLHFLL